MLYGNPYEGLLKTSYQYLTPEPEPFSRPFLDRKVRVGYIFNYFKEGKTRTLNTRVREYVFATFNPNSQGYWSSMSRDIRAMVGVADYESDSEILDVARYEARRLLKVDILHVTKDVYEAGAAERFYMYFFNARDPDLGYNTQFGGTVSRFDISALDAMAIIKEKGLTWWDIDAAMKRAASSHDTPYTIATSIGLSVKELNKILTYYYSDIETWEENGKLYEIKYKFPGLHNNRPNKFLKIRDLYRGIKILTLFVFFSILLLLEVLEYF